jgi:hypothetical protein
MMKVFSPMIRSFIRGLFLPVGSPSKELATYDPVDKPILRYESLLFWIMLSVSLLVKAVMKLSTSGTYGGLLLIIPLLLSSIVILVSLFKLLIPPRISASRVAFIVIAAIMILMLLSKN